MVVFETVKMSDAHFEKKKQRTLSPIPLFFMLSVLTFQGSVTALT